VREAVLLDDLVTLRALATARTTYSASSATLSPTCRLYARMLTKGVVTGVTGTKPSERHEKLALM